MHREGPYMKFRIVKPGTNEDVFGGPVSKDNVYISAYPSIQPGSLQPQDLDVGAHAVAKYNLSGTTGTYWIVRVE